MSRRTTRADLIVVGNQGMTGARRFLLGSVPNRVAHHTPCDVLIVKTDLGAASPAPQKSSEGASSSSSCVRSSSAIVSTRAFRAR